MTEDNKKNKRSNLNKSFLEIQRTSREIRERYKFIQTKDSLKSFYDTIRTIQSRDPLTRFQATVQSFRFANQLESFRATIEEMQANDPLKEIRKTIEILKTNNALRGIEETVEMIQAHDPLKDIRSTLKAFQPTVPFEDIRKLTEIINVNNSIEELRKTIRKYHQITNLYKDIFSESTPATTFEKAYQEVLLRFASAQFSDGCDHSEAAVIVANEISNQVTTSQPSKLSIEFYLNLIVAFIFLLYSINLSQQSEKRVLQSMTSAQTTIIERIAKLEGPKEIGSYYIVKRTVNLRTKPKTKGSAVINVLYPNQKVRLVSRKGKWIKIEYYNHILNCHESGWCYKKYLKKIK